MIKFIDAHAHLIEPYFTYEQVKEVIQNAKKEGVGQIINCASDPKHFESCMKTLGYPEIGVTIGLQPTLAKKITSAEPIRKLLEEHPQGKKVLAIGEVGLDYYWIKDEKHRELQKKMFIDCISLANENNLPLVIHARKAEMDSLELLSKHAEVQVLLHSFEGNQEAISLAKDLGYKITVPTNVVIRSNRRKVAARMGLENILLETDSPYCPPAIDIKPNTPKTIPIAANKLVSILSADIEEISTVTIKNTREFYKI